MLSDAATRNAAAATFQAATRRGTQLDESGQLGNRKHALFGLLMQATAGDCRMSKPPEPSAGGDEVLRWMAWKKRQGMTREAAMQAYVDQINLIDEELSTGGAAIMESAYGCNGYYSSGELLTSSEPVYKTGILYKQRDVFKGWRPRKFILKDGVLSYYISDDDPTPRNQLILEGCTVEALKVPSSSKRIDGEVVGFYPFVVTHPDSAKAYYLASTCSEDTDDWIKALRSVATPARRASIRRKASMDNSRQYRRVDNANGFDGSGNGQRNIGELGGDDLKAALMRGIGSSLIPFEMWGSVSKAMELLQEYTSSTDGWDAAYCRSDVQVYRRTGGVVSCVRGDGVIEQHPVSVLLAILDLDRRRLYDGQLEFARRVKLFNAHTFLDYLRCRAMWPTSARDLYVTVHWQVLDDGTVVLVKFTDNDKYPEEAGCVRAECILAGWVIRPIANPTLLPPTPSSRGAAAPTAAPIPAGEGSRGQLWSNVTFVEQLDLKGTLPTRIKNSVAESQPMLIASLRKFLSTHEGSDDYRCPREQQVGYNNPTVEVLLDNLNRRVLASEAAQPFTKRPVHQRSLSIKEIQSDLPYHLDGQIEDAVQALLEEEEKMEGWDLFHDKDGDTGYMKEGDDADLSVLRVRTQGVIEHPALAVLQAITTLDFVNIWDSAIEFSTHEMLHNVHTWITYERLKAMYPMPSRDVCQLVHWRIVEDQGKLVVVSVDNDSHPEDAAYVRAHMYEGWVLHPSKENKSCRVTTIWSVDIRGVMTNKIRKQMAQNQAAKLSSVRRFLDEYRRGSGAASILALQPVELTNLAVQPLVVQWNHWSPAMLPDRINLGDAVPRKRRGSSSLAGSPNGTLTPSSRHDSKALDMDLRLAAMSMPKLPRSASAPAPHTASRRASEPHRPFVMSGVLSSMPGTPINLVPAHARPPRPRANSKSNEELSQPSLPIPPIHPQSSQPSQPSSAWSTPQRKVPTPFTHLESPTTTPFLTSPAATPTPSSFKAAASPPLSQPSGVVVPPPPSLVVTSIYHLFLLLSPVLLYFSADPAYRGITFCLAVIASVRMVVISRSPRSYASAFRGTEWGQDSIKSKVFVRCPVQLTYLKRYLVAKRKAGMKASVVHVAIKALGRALTEVPQLNGHVLLGRFVPCASVDVSYEAKLKNREETSALVKLCGVEGRSVPDLALDLEAMTSALLQCRDPFFERRKLLLSLCPTPLVPLLDQLFTYLGAGLGLSLPRLGIRAFPQGSAVVIVSPSVDSSSTSPSTSTIGHAPPQPHALDCEYMVEPDERTGQYLAPLVLNIGSVSPMARMVDKEQGLAMVEVLHLSITARLNGSGNLQDVRRLADKVQTYMRNPELLDRPALSPIRSLAPAGSAASD